MEKNKLKTQKQLESYEGEKYIVADNIEIGFGNKVPLWMFGFLYWIPNQRKSRFVVRGLGVNWLI